MSQYDPEKIEEYQLILLKNPRSPVFAALAEAYRRMGLLDEALDVSQKGVKHNPEFVSGLVAHGKVLYDLKNYSEALKVLTKAHLLSRENLLALRLLGHCQAKMKLYPEALKSFKKLLITAPTDQTALEFVKTWEFLEQHPLLQSHNPFELADLEAWLKRLPGVEDALHLIDSFLHNQEKRTALEITNAARLVWPQHAGLKSRQELLYQTPHDEDVPPPPPGFDENEFKKAFYRHLLRRIEQRKSLDPN